jgi:sulfatase modifying factor 1
MRGRLLVCVLAALAALATLAALGATACGSHADDATPAGDGASGDGASGDTAHVGPSEAGTPLDAAPDATDAAPADGAPSSSPCPDESALVTADSGAVCVDLYEGALVQRDGDGGESPWPWYLPVDGLDAGTVRAVPAKGTFPQGYISQVQATAACNASGKRLCTFAEWTAACRGQPMDDYVYPYGNTYEAGRCNEGHTSPIVELFGPNPSYDNQELNDPRCDQLEGGLAQGGAYAGCESAYGAFDMHGNIHEWIEATSPAGPDDGIFLGGYFVDATENGPGCTYETTAHAKTYHDYSTGFRCCANVP